MNKLKKFDLTPLLIILTIMNELKAGTVHYDKTGRKLTNVKEILEAMRKGELYVEFHCKKCGAIIKDVVSIEKRLCERCRGKET